MKFETISKVIFTFITGGLMLATLFLLPAPALADEPFCSAPNLTITDAFGVGGENGAYPGPIVTDTIVIPDGGTISDLNLSISVTHPYVGDLVFTLTHKIDSTVISSTEIISRPKGIRPSGGNSEPACTGDNINIILDDEASLTVHDDCNEDIDNPDDPTILAYIDGESYRPYTYTVGIPGALYIFDGQPLSGTWELAVNDNFEDVIDGDGTLHQWCLLYGQATSDLQILKNDGVTTVTPGSAVTYTITYTNAAWPAHNIVITETLPTNTSFNAAASPGWNQVGATNQYTRSVDYMTPNLTQNIAFVVTVANPLPAGVANVANTVQIGDDGTNGVDQNLGDNSDTELTPVNAVPDLRINKDDAGLTVNPGGAITYTLTYTNAGNQNATGVVLTETLPLYTSFNSATPAGWHQVGATNQYTYSVGNMNVGPSQAITFVVTVDSSPPGGVTNISNTAQVGDDKTNGADSNSSNNTDTETTGLAGQAGSQEKTFLPVVLKDN
jgi:uncharacterized repeat protein (TIGR01451 family)